jgi:hypothetical protein
MRSSDLNVSLFAADNPSNLTAGGLNQNAQSYSVKLLFSPDSKLTFGAKLMHARRALENSVDGTFQRLQLSAIYYFGYTAAE